MSNADHGLLLLSSNEVESLKNSQTKKKSGRRLIQFLSPLSASLPSLGNGAASMWTSPALPYLKSKESEIIVSDGQSPWITSLFNLGSLIGFIIYPFLVDRIGRKYTFLIFSLPQIASWTLIYFARNVETLYVARTLSGIGYSTYVIILEIYLAEIAQKNIRGTIVIIPKIFYCIGMLSVVTVGAVVSYNSMNLIFFLLSLLFFIPFAFIPESPYFYLKQNQEENAIKSLFKLRGTNDREKLKIEINRMKEDITENQMQEKWILGSLFRSKRHRKALLIVFIANITLPLSGTFAIGAYNQQIFSYSGISLEPRYSVVVLLVLSLFFGILTVSFADYFGRRLLTLYSGIISGLSLGIVSMFFYFKSNPEIVDVSSITWMILVAMITFEVACGTGLVSVAVILAAELFSVEVKSSALALIYIMMNIIRFLVELGFEWSVKMIDIHGTFAVYSIFCILLPLLNFFIMPETKGKTLEDIQKLLS